MRKLMGLVLGIVLTMALTSLVPASADIVAYWPMDEGSGTVYHDVINGNDGTPPWGTPAWVSGHTGNAGDYALNFAQDPTGWGYVDAGNGATLNLADTISIDFWVKAGPQEWSPGIIHKRNHDPGRRGYDVRATNSDAIDILIVTDALGGSEQVKTMPGVLDNEWHHVTWVLDHGIVKGYNDGTLVVDDTYLHGTGFADPAEPLLMAEWGDFIGTIDDVKIYSQVIPEPGSLLLLGTGLLGLISMVRRKRR